MFAVWGVVHGMNDGQDMGPFGGSPDPEPRAVPGKEPVEEPKAFNVLGLRNDTPAVTPSLIGEQLDLAAEWWEHLACGFSKQRSSENPEAWEHYVLAAILFGREAGMIPEEVDWDDVGDADDSSDDDTPGDYDSMMDD